MNSAREPARYNRPSNDRDNRDNNFQRKNFKNRRTEEKFVPNFKKKLPTWKQIDSELKDLSDKYDQVDT